MKDFTNNKIHYVKYISNYLSHYKTLNNQLYNLFLPERSCQKGVDCYGVSLDQFVYNIEVSCGSEWR